MKIRLSEKYFKVRLTIICTIGLFLFLSWIAIQGTSDFLLKKEELNKETGNILSVKLSYDTIKRFVKPTKYERCVDIAMTNNKSFIRLTFDFDELYSSAQVTDFRNKPITFYYHDRRSRKNKIYNPIDLTIDNRKFFDYDKRVKKERILGSLFILFDIAVLCVAIIGFKTYIERQIIEDKSLLSEKKYLKVLGKWFSE